MDSAIIEVGLGLVLVYFVLSIVITQLNNLIVNSLNLRAENLHAWFLRNVADDVRNDLMVGLGVMKRDDEAQHKPNIIRRFSNWLGRKLVGILVPGADQHHDSTNVSNITPSVFTDALLGICAQRCAFAPADQADAAKLHDLTSFVTTAVTDSSLAAVLAGARTYDDARSKVTAWFDNAMNHLTAIFKLRVQLIGFTAGLFICIALNVDTLYLARTLWNDPTMRQTVAEAASRTLNNPSAQGAEAPARSVEDLTNELQPLLDLRLPIGWEITPVVVCSVEELAAQTCTPTAEAVAETSQGSPRNLANFLPANNPTGGWLNFVLYKLAGWILTTFAIMQGSDFWFNLLGRLTAARTNVSKINEAITGGQISSGA